MNTKKLQVLAILFIVSLTTVQAQWKAPFISAAGANAAHNGKDWPKITNAVYIKSLNKAFFIIKSKGGFIGYRFDPATKKFKMLSNFRNAGFIQVYPAANGHSAVLTYRKGSSTYLYKPKNGGQTIVRKKSGFYTSAASTGHLGVSFDGSNLFSPIYPEKNRKPIFDKGYLVYQEVHKPGSGWKSLQLHQAINNAIKKTKHYQGGKQTAMISKFKKAGNGYLVNFQYRGKSLLGWVKLVNTGSRLKIQQVKFPMVQKYPYRNFHIKEIVSYRGKHYAVAYNNQILEFDYNGNFVKMYPLRTFLDLVKQKKQGKYYSNAKNILEYDLKRNKKIRNDNASFSFIAGNVRWNITVKEAPGSPRNKLKWNLHADKLGL